MLPLPAYYRYRLRSLDVCEPQVPLRHQPSQRELKARSGIVKAMERELRNVMAPHLTSTRVEVKRTGGNPLLRA